jgi:hypothetical protein
MKRYKAVNRVELHAGILELTKKQSLPRAHCLQDLGEGFFEITGKVEFKVGEEFGYDGEVTKAMAQDLTAAEAEKKERK